MNGVRRFLGGGGGSTPATPEPATPPELPSTAPLSISSKTSWPPSSPTSQSQPGSPPRDILQASVTPLSFRKDKARPLLPDGDTNGADGDISRPVSPMTTSPDQPKMPAPMSPAETVAGVRSGEELLRRLSLTTTMSRPRYPELGLSERIISAAFAIPYSVSFNKDNPNAWVSGREKQDSNVKQLIRIRHCPLVVEAPPYSTRSLT